MTMKIITGYTGTKHITPDDDASFNQGIVGLQYYIPYVLNQSVWQFGYEEISINKIKINQGVAVCQGRLGINDEYGQELNIDSVSNGYHRVDAVIIEYTKDPVTLVESMELKIKKGTANARESAPISPSYVQGDIFSGATSCEFPLYEILVDNNSGTTTLTPSQKYIGVDDLDSLTQSVYTIANLTHIVDAGTDGGWTYQKYSDGTYHAWQVHSIGTSTSATSKTQSISLPSFNDGTNYAVWVTQNADTYVVNTFRVDTITAASFRVVIALQSASTAQPKFAISVWGEW